MNSSILLEAVLQGAEAHFFDVELLPKGVYHRQQGRRLLRRSPAESSSSQIHIPSGPRASCTGFAKEGGGEATAFLPPNPLPRRLLPLQLPFQLGSSISVEAIIQRLQCHRAALQLPPGVVSLLGASKRRSDFQGPCRLALVEAQARRHLAGGQASGMQCVPLPTVLPEAPKVRGRLHQHAPDLFQGGHEGVQADVRHGDGPPRFVGAGAGDLPVSRSLPRRPPFLLALLFLLLLRLPRRPRRPRGLCRRLGRQPAQHLTGHHHAAGLHVERQGLWGQVEHVEQEQQALRAHRVALRG
eukprot:scaffold7024_cov229-Pinguiococcus_pyrenoidosus.AAC.5